MLGLVVAMGCGGEDGPAPTERTYYRDVKPIIDGRCGGCHSDGNIAPFALTGYDEVAALRELVKTVTGERSMPPWSATPGHVAYRFDPSLSDEQIAIIAGWVDAGAPEGDPSDEGAPLASVDQTMSRVDKVLQMPVSYTPTATPDEYRCFVLDWPETATTFVTGFNAKPDNKTIDHHIAAFLVRPDNPLGEGVFDELAALEAQDPEPGYTCFGGPGGESDAFIPAQQIGQWVPGQGGGDYPAGSGIEVPPGSKIVLQMHYFTGLGVDGPDQTSIELSVEESVDKSGAFAPWLNSAWVFGGMEIPAGDPEVVHDHTADPRGFIETFIGSTDVSDGFFVHAIMLHMHRLGRRGHVAIQGQDGEQVLLRIDDYDFDWQRLYHLETPIRFHAGDELTVECVWDNSGADGTVPETVNWGEGTSDEMCVGNLYITEP
jgi:hypothetical protein